MNMYGPFLLMWIVTILPLAFVPMWIHPMHRDGGHGSYKTFAWTTLAATWLLAGTVALLFGPGWSGWVWLGTELLFATLIWRAIKARRHLSHLTGDVDAEWARLSKETH
jgi:hypothetical protein